MVLVAAENVIWGSEGILDLWLWEAWSGGVQHEEPRWVMPLFSPVPGLSSRPRSAFAQGATNASFQVMHRVYFISVFMRS